MITGSLTEHYRLKKHLISIGFSIDSLCDKCGGKTCQSQEKCLTINQSQQWSRPNEFGVVNNGNPVSPGQSINLMCEIKTKFSKKIKIIKGLTIRLRQHISWSVKSSAQQIKPEHVINCLYQLNLILIYKIGIRYIQCFCIFRVCNGSNLAEYTKCPL